MNFQFYVGFNTVDGDLNQNKFFVPLYGAAYAAPNKSTPVLYFLLQQIKVQQFYTNFLMLFSSFFQLSISKLGFYHVNHYLLFVPERNF